MRHKAWLRVFAIAITAVMCTLVILSAVFPFPMGTWDFLSIGTSQKASANPDWLSGWDYRTEITVTNAVANYTTMVLVDQSYRNNQKYANNPVMPANDGDAWDYNKGFPSVIYNASWAEASRYRIWYTSISASEDPQEINTCYAYSADGITWTKPNLGLVSYGGNTNNNILIADEMVTSVVYDSGTYYLLSGENWGDPISDGAFIYSSTSPDSGFSLIKTVYSDDGPTLPYHHIATSLVKRADGKWLVYDQYRDASNYRNIVCWLSDTTSITGNWTDQVGVGGICISDNGVNDQRYAADVWIDDEGKYQATVMDYNPSTALSNLSRWESSNGLTGWSEIIPDWITRGALGEWDQGYMSTGSHVDFGDGVWRHYFMGAEGDHDDTRVDIKSGIGYVYNLDAQCMGNVAADFDDLRFTGQDGDSGDLLDYWIERVTGTTPNCVATVWSENNADADTTLFMYYGGTETAVSNGTATFIHFEDFEWGSNGDPISNSGGSVTWTIDAGDVDISTEQDIGNVAGYTGSRSMKLIGNDVNTPEASIPVTKSDSIAIRWRTYKENLSYMTMRHGDGSAVASPLLGASGVDISYYDGLVQDTGADSAADAWKLWEVNDFVWATPSFDIWHEDSEIQADATMWTNADYANAVHFIGQDETGADTWIDDVIVRKWAATEPSFAFGSQETETPEITNTPSSNNFGILEVNTTSNTAINYFQIENTGNCAVDVVIYGTDATGGDDTWTLSDTATPGENTYGLYAGLDDADDQFDVIVRKTETYNTLVSDLIEDATQDWGLKIYMPTSVTDYDGQQMTGTITLVASAS